LIPRVPGLSSLVPVVDTLVLLVPALAACCVVGWFAGGSPWMALTWSALAAAVLVLPAPPATNAPYYALARGWGAIVAGAFGIVCLVGRSQPFIHRVLSAIAAATLLSLGLAAFGRFDARSAQNVFAGEFDARNAAAVAEMRLDATVVQKSFPKLATMARDAATQQEAVQGTISRAAAPLFPASLALEALAACALAWALFHRLSRVRIGAPLAPLRQFTFGDQLVWALVAGIVMVIVPSLDALAAVGRNLLLFFGTLYALRGYGIYAWFVSRRAAVTSVAVAVAAFPLSLVTVPWAVGLGLSDTWFDWRRRVKSTLAGRKQP
ncbi:MAG TPA: hypothetical protein VIC55_10845, partial [Gemmatimonadaceae bacterium]